MLWLPLDTVRQHLNVEVKDDDGKLALLIQASQAHIERVTGTRLGTATEHVYRRDFSNTIIPAKPFGSIWSVTYEKDGVLATLPASDYVVRYWDGSLPMVVFKTSETPDDGSVKITYTCGYGYAVPQDLVNVALALIALWYSNREAYSPLGLSAVPGQDLDALADWNIRERFR